MSDEPPKKQRRPRPGQPRFEPNDNQRQLVTVLHAHGISHSMIAKRIFHARDLDQRGRPKPGAKGISIPTLREAFREELDEAHEVVKIGMIQALIRAANAGNWGAARFWLATQGGPEWRVVEERRVSGDPEGTPIRVSVHHMSDSDLDRELREIDDREQALAEARKVAQGLPKRSNGLGS
jgi:hypothetical protein